jgi:hypothetical protein
VCVCVRVCMGGFCNVWASWQCAFFESLRLPWLRFFRAFSSVVRQMPGYNLQRLGMANTLPNLLFVLFCCYSWCSMYCLCVNVYCHRVSTQLQLTNISISIRFPAVTVVSKKNTGLWRHAVWQKLTKILGWACCCHIHGWRTSKWKWS